MIKIWIIRIFGLEGSFTWALKQMQKGSVVYINGNNDWLYALDSTNESGRIIYNKQPINPVFNRDWFWDSAVITTDMIKSTSWRIKVNKAWGNYLDIKNYPIPGLVLPNTYFIDQA